MYKKVIFGTDGSDNANRVAEKIIEFQQKWNCKVVVFHSIKHKMIPETLIIPHLKLSKDIYDSVKTFAEQSGDYILKKTKEILDPIKNYIEFRLITDEAPEDYIKRIAKAEGIDLVFLGCKGGHSKLEEKFVGTVCMKLLREPPCDVLIVC